MRRTIDQSGPQVDSYFHTLEKLQGQNKSCRIQNTTSVVNEDRLAAIEEHIHIKHPSKANVCDRIKDIESRLLILESLSPEYTQFIDWLSNRQGGKCKSHSTKKKCYSAQDIDNFIANINQTTDS